MGVCFYFQSGSERFLPDLFCTAKQNFENHPGVVDHRQYFFSADTVDLHFVFEQA